MNKLMYLGGKYGHDFNMAMAVQLEEWEETFNEVLSSFIKYENKMTKEIKYKTFCFLLSDYKDYIKEICLRRMRIKLYNDEVSKDEIKLYKAIFIKYKVNSLPCIDDINMSINDIRNENHDIYYKYISYKPKL